MMNWDSLINEAALASVLPDAYAPYGRPLHGALAVFLEGLPAAHQHAILMEQASLPPSSTVSERLGLLAQRCPVLHKLGQTLARDRNLSAELRWHLQRLESLPPSVPLETIESILVQELGPLERFGVRLLPPALAEGSVAVVIPFHVSEKEVLCHGVFKVLKPGVEERLEHELELLAKVGSYLDQSCDDLQIPHLDYREIFEQVGEKLRYEIRLDMEQHNLRTARAFYKGDSRVRVPAVFDFCTARITAMERVTGQKVTDCRLDSISEMRQLAELVVETLIARPMFSAAPQAPFHGDPHAGNLFLGEDHRLAILDWSLVGSLGERQRILTMQIMLGAMSFNVERIVNALSGLCEWRCSDMPALRSVAHSWLRRIRQGQLPGLTWLMGLLDEAVRNAGLRVGADLTLFRKALHMIDGVIAHLGVGANLVDQVLASEFLRHFAAEWPKRFLSFPDSRSFATRVSNIDLAELMLNLPSSAVHFWLHNSSEMLNLARCATTARARSPAC